MTGANILPSTWYIRVKKFYDCIIWKFKTIFFVRDDKKEEGVYYFEKYTPAVSCTTVRLMMSLSVNQGWDTRQVNFYNGFSQATLVEDVYLTLPKYFDSETGKYIARMDINIKNKSL